MTKEDVIELLDEEAIFYDEFEAAIIGVADRFGMPTVVCYDKDKVIEILKNGFTVEDDDIDEEERKMGVTIEDKKLEMAYEWFGYNTLGAWNGDFTPVFITTKVEE